MQPPVTLVRIENLNHGVTAGGGYGYILIILQGNFLAGRVVQFWVEFLHLQGTADDNTDGKNGIIRYRDLHIAFHNFLLFAVELIDIAENIRENLD